MIVPNKAISYEQSLLSKLPSVLKYIEDAPCSLLDLYNQVKYELGGINQFMLAMDTLYVLGKINVDYGE